MFQSTKNITNIIFSDTLITLLGVVDFSIQKDNKTEDINAILDKLIKQTEGGMDNTTIGTQYEVKEKSGNESKIIYVKTHANLDLPNIIIPYITGDSKGINNNNSSDQPNYDTVSEELVLEIEAQPNNGRREDLFNIQDFVKSLNDNTISRSAFPDDYLENNMPEHKLNTYVPEIQNQPNLLSRYPDVIIDPESNKKTEENNEFIKEMVKDLMKNNEEPLLSESNTNTPGESFNEPTNNNPEMEDEFLTRLMNLNKEPQEILDIIGIGNIGNPQNGNNYPAVPETVFPGNMLLDNLATVNLNAAIKHHMMYQKYLDSISLPGGPYYVSLPQKVRTVIHHPGPVMPAQPQWNTGNKYFISQLTLHDS